MEKLSIKSILNQSNVEMLKPPSQNLIKENDAEFDFFDTVETNDSEKGLNSKTVYEIPFQLKMAILANSLPSFQKDMWNLYAEYDMYTRKDGASTAKRGQQTRDEFNKLLKDGRRVVTFVGTDRDLNNEEKKQLSSWLNKKDYNVISYKFSQGTLSENGKAVLEFLARLMSDSPRGEDEKIITTSIYKDSYKTTAEHILRSFFELAIPPIIARMTKKKELDSELREYVMVGIDHAIDGLSRNNKYDVERNNVGAWFIQVVKNYVIDQLRKVTEYKLDVKSLDQELGTRQGYNDSGLIYIKSKLNPKETNTENVLSTKQDGNLWIYEYKNAEDAMSDFAEQLPHLNQWNLPKEEKEKFYASVRKYDIKGQDENDLFEPEHSIEENVPMQKEAEQLIKDLVSDIAEEMMDNTSNIFSEFIQKGNYSTKYAEEQIKSAENDLKTTKKEENKEKLEQIIKERQKKLEHVKKSKKILVDFVYSLLQFNKGEEGGKALKKFVDDFNEETIEQYKTFSKENEGKSGEELKIELIDRSLWIPEVEVSRFATQVQNRLQKYFTSIEKKYSIKNKEVFDKIKELVGIAMPSITTQRTFEEAFIANNMILEEIKVLMKSVIKENETTTIGTDLQQIQSIGEALSLTVDKNLLNNEILSITKTGIGKLIPTNDYALSRDKRKEFDYITTTLVILYKNANADEKDKIKRYIFSAFMGEKRPNFVEYVAKAAGIMDVYKNDQIYEIAKDVIYDNIPFSIESFDSVKNVTFKTWLTTVIKTRIINELRKQLSRMEDGERKWDKRTVSIDEPIGDEDDGSGSLADKIPAETEEPEIEQSEERQINLLLAKTINDYIKNIIKDKDAYMKFYNLYVEKDMSLDAIYKEMSDKDPRNIRLIKFRLEETISRHIKSGELREFVLQTTGKDINDYPKFRNIMKQDRKFKFGDLFADKKEDEPVEINEVRKLIRQIINEAF